MSGALPEVWPLGGVDAILLAMSDGMRRRVGHDASCRLAVWLDGQVDPDRLGMSLKTSEVWRWLTSLRLIRRGLGAPAWRVERQAPEVPMALYFQPSPEALRDVLQSAQGHVGDPRVGPALGLGLHHVGDGTSALVLTWHHVLLDARGAELLLHAIARGALDALPIETLLGPAPPRDEGWWRRLRMARQARNRLFAIGLGSVAFLRGPAEASPAPVWRRRVLSVEHSAQAQARAVEAGAGLLRSAWHLTAVARPLDRHLAATEVRARDLLIPVPQDQRRRGASGPVLGNRISTLFYRLPRAALAHPAAAVKALGEQLRAGVRTSWPAAYLVLMDMVRGLPGWALRALVGLPSRGRVATFGFSDVGECLRGVETLRDLRILDVAHYPANLHPPGVTVVVSRHGGRLAVCVASLPGRLGEGGAQALVDRIAASLVEGDG